MSIGEQSWLKEKLGDANTWFATWFSSEPKQRPQTFIAHTVQKIRTLMPSITDDLNTEMFASLTHESGLLKSGMWNIQIIHDVIACTLPQFLRSIITHYSTTFYAVEMKNYDFQFMTLCIEKLKKRSIPTGATTVEDQFYQWATTIFSLHLIAEGSIIADEMAREFYDSLQLSNERMLIAQHAVITIMDKIYQIWKAKLTERIFKLLGEGCGTTTYDSAKKYLDIYAMYRMNTAEPANVKYETDGSNGVKVTITDKSLWWWQVLMRVNAATFCRYELSTTENGNMKTILDADVVDEQLLTWTTLSFDNTFETTMNLNKVLEYCKTITWIDYTSVRNYMQEGKVAFPTHTENFNVVFKSDGIKKLVASTSVKENNTSQDLKSMWVEIQIADKNKASTIILFGNKISTQTTISTELAHIYCMRGLACLFPMTSPVGQIEIRNSNLPGMSDNIHNIMNSNSGISTNTIFPTRVLKALGVNEVIDSNTYNFIGSELLERIIKMLQALGFEDFKKELLGSTYADINAESNAIVMRDFHAEWSTSKADAAIRAPFSEIKTKISEAMVLRTFLMGLTNTAWKAAVHHAFSIATTHRTSDIAKGSLLNDIFAGSVS